MPASHSPAAPCAYRLPWRMTHVMTDVDPSDETVRLTYVELAKARGISLNAARRMTLRHRWPKQIGNDGMTRVSVPVSALTYGDTPGDVPVDAAANAVSDIPPAVTLAEASIAAVARATAQATIDGVSDAMSQITADLIRDATADIRQILPTLQEAITTLRVQLYAERDRAECAERQVQELRVEAAVRRRWWRRR